MSYFEPELAHKYYIPVKARTLLTSVANIGENGDIVLFNRKGQPLKRLETLFDISVK